MGFVIGVFMIMLVFGFFWMVWAVTGGISKGAEKQRTLARGKADETYAELFDGRQTVIYEASDATLSPEEVIAAGEERGYEVLSVEAGKHPGFGQKLVTFRRTDGNSAT